MTTVNISLPQPLKEFVDSRVAQGSYSTVSEYFRELIRQDQERAADRELEGKLLEGLRSGTPIKGDAAYWDKKKSDLMARLKKDSRR